LRQASREGGDNFEKLSLRGGEVLRNPHPNGGKGFENFRTGGVQRF
jgi:hypothetical protein